MFKTFREEKYWNENAHLYDIEKVLQFCGSETYIKKAVLYHLDLLDAVGRLPLDDLFFQRFSRAPVPFRDAIQKNSNLTEAFFERVLPHINWEVLCENRGLDISFFRRNLRKFNPVICRNPRIRKDVFDLFDIASVEKSLTRAQLIACPHYSSIDKIEVKTGADRAAFVSRFLRKKATQTIDGKFTDENYTFWKNQYLADPVLCASFCDCDNFIIFNKNMLDWSAICGNPKVPPHILRMRYFDIDGSALLSRGREVDSLIYSFAEKYTDEELYNRYIFLKNGKLSSRPDDKKYLGNLYFALKGVC